MCILLIFLRHSSSHLHGGDSVNPRSSSTEATYFNSLSHFLPVLAGERFLLFHGLGMKDAMGGKIFSNPESVGNFQRGRSTCFESWVKALLFWAPSTASGLVFSIWLLKFCYLSSLIPLGVWPTYQRSYIFQKEYRSPSIPWEYGLATLHFFSCLLCSKVDSLAGLCFSCFCFSKELISMSKVNSLKALLDILIYVKRWNYIISEVKRHMPLQGQHLVSQEGFELSVPQPPSSLWLLSCFSKPSYIWFQCWGLIPGPGMCRTSTFLLSCISGVSTTSFWSPKVFRVGCVKICAMCQSLQE